MGHDNRWICSSSFVYAALFWPINQFQFNWDETHDLWTLCFYFLRIYDKALVSCFSQYIKHKLWFWFLKCVNFESYTKIIKFYSNLVTNYRVHLSQFKVMLLNIDTPSIHSIYIIYVHMMRRSTQYWVWCTVEWRNFITSQLNGTT